MKTPKVIQSVKDLKSGLYIKAFVNYLGDYKIFVENVVKNPYKAKCGGFCTNMWMVKTKSTYSGESFVGDLIGHDKKTHILIPYSAELFEKLKKMDRFQFLEFINKKQLSFGEKSKFYQYWEYEQYKNKEMKRKMERMYYDEQESD